MAVVLVTITCFVAGFSLATWLVLFNASTNITEISMKTKTLLMPRLEGQLDKHEKAWFFLDYMNYYQDTIEFDPNRKSLRLFKKNYPHLGEGLPTSHAENENFGIFNFITVEDANEQILIQKMDKISTKVSTVKLLSAAEYDARFVAISGKENIVLFTKINGTGCQEIQLMFPDGQISGYGIPMLNCRQRPSCVASTASGDVYIFGIGAPALGNTEQESEKYDHNSGAFVTIGRIPDPTIIQTTCKAIEHRGKIFVCENGGTSACASYDPELNRWRLVGTFETYRSNFELESVGGGLYAVWGKDVKSIEKFNEIVGAWEIYMEDVSEVFTSDYDFISFIL